LYAACRHNSEKTGTELLNLPETEQCIFDEGV
uniref:Lysozyme n=1 Tax=Mesocestoides corti TaxID=53468 RepID=A0A0R3UDR9_MESCO